MRNRFDHDLEILNNELIEMGSLVEKAIDNAVEGLARRDINYISSIASFDQEIDEKERQIEHHCLKLLLQQQPVASDLRIISTALKLITDMERIGDQAEDILEIAKRLATEPNPMKLEHIPMMAVATRKMVRESIDAFVEKDLDHAKRVCLMDDSVDDLFNIIKDDLIQQIHKDPDCGEQAIDYMMIAKYFERIGDHAENIAEWVIFSITGSHVRY